MTYKEVKRQLVKMIYTEMPRSIFRISRLSLKLRVATAIFLMLCAVCFIFMGSYLYAAAIAFYAVGVVLFGYTQGLTCAIIPIMIYLINKNILYLENFVLLIVFFMVAFIFLFQIYEKVFNGGYYTSKLHFERDGYLIEYEDALSRFIPIDNFYKCLTVSIDNHVEDDFIMLNQKIIKAAIALCAKTGIRRGFLYAGHMVTYNNEKWKVFFYTSGEIEERVITFIHTYFETYARLNIKTHSEDDVEWATYINELKPDIYQRQEIYNEKYIRYLENRNFDFERQYKLLYRFKVRYGVHFPVFVDELKNLGYEEAPKGYNLFDDGSVLYVVCKQGKIGKYRIDMISREFLEIARKYNFELYDWRIGEDSGIRF